MTLTSEPLLGETAPLMAFSSNCSVAVGSLWEGSSEAMVLILVREIFSEDTEISPGVLPLRGVDGEQGVPWMAAQKLRVLERREEI